MQVTILRTFLVTTMRPPSNIMCPISWVNTNPPSAPDIGVGETVVFTETRVGESVPNYKQKIAKHVSATGNYNLVTGTVSSPGRVKSSSLVFGTEVTNDVSGFPVNASMFNAPPDIVTRVIDIANAKIRSKINSDNANFDALVPIGELRELRGLIGGIADSGSAIVKALIALKSGRNSIHPAHVAAVAGDMWLQWGFGVAPMISDAQKAAEALASRSLRIRRLRYTGMHYEDFFLPINEIEFALNGTPGWHFDSRTVIQGRVQCRISGGSLRGVNSSFDNITLQDSFGLHANRLPSVAWELMPYSWLADYFGTAGAFLDTAFEAPNTDLYYITQSLFTKFTCVKTFTPQPSQIFGNVERVSASSEDFKMEIVKFNRSSLANLPVRALRFKSYDEIANNSVTKVLNLAAILASGIGRRARINVF